MYQDRQPGTSGLTIRRVAVLVDRQNIGPCRAGAILARSGGLGKIQTSRVYGGENETRNWAGKPGFQFVFCGKAKNSADIRLSIDAVDLSHRGGADSFVIVSSDSDFTHLAHFLRERGHDVVGLGGEKTGDQFKGACTSFHAFEIDRETRTAATSCSLEELLSDVILGNAGKDGVRIADLNPLIRSAYAGFQIGLHRDKSWRAYLAARPALFDCDPKGPEARVRLRAKT